MLFVIILVVCTEALCYTIAVSGCHVPFLESVLYLSSSTAAFVCLHIKHLSDHI